MRGLRRLQHGVPEWGDELCLPQSGRPGPAAAHGADCRDGDDGGDASPPPDSDGESDGPESLDFSKEFDVLTKLGAPVKLTLYPDAQHDSWTATYDNPEVWKWLFEQHK